MKKGKTLDKLTLKEIQNIFGNDVKSAEDLMSKINNNNFGIGPFFGGLKPACPFSRGCPYIPKYKINLKEDYSLF